MKNHEGNVVVGGDHFTIGTAQNYQKFRQMDAIRLLEFWLDSWVSLDAMQQQGEPRAQKRFG